MAYKKEFLKFLFRIHKAKYYYETLANKMNSFQETNLMGSSGWVTLLVRIREILVYISAWNSIMLTEDFRGSSQSL
jgi:hypothetical protein